MRPRVLGVTLATVAIACADGSDAPPPAASLVREGARPTIMRVGDLDGGGGPEVVVASVAGEAGGLGTPHLEIFRRRGTAWPRVFDATGHAPPGPPETPSEMLAAGPGFVAQSVHMLELVDFRAGGTPEVVAAIASAGATAGPVELWILSMDQAGGLRTEFYEGTERGGEVVVHGDRLTFRFPVYRAGDPGCCPSRIETQEIGHDPAEGRIVVLERDRART
ncbi:MAG: hypothetical protein ACRDHB_09185 [Actinomycetota bacterium]